MKKKYQLFTLAAIFMLTSCKPSFDDPKYDNGEADFSSYVALGDAYTAGFADNALYAEGQMNSYPSLLAAQFKKAGGNGVFKIPLIDQDNAVKGVRPGPVPSLPLRTTTRLILASATDC